MGRFKACLSLLGLYLIFRSQARAQVPVVTIIVSKCITSHTIPPYGWISTNGSTIPFTFSPSPNHNNPSQSLQNSGQPRSPSHNQGHSSYLSHPSESFEYSRSSSHNHGPTSNTPSEPIGYHSSKSMGIPNESSHRSHANTPSEPSGYHSSQFLSVPNGPSHRSQVNTPSEPSGYHSSESVRIPNGPNHRSNAPHTRSRHRGGGSGNSPPVGGGSSPPVTIGSIFSTPIVAPPSSTIAQSASFGVVSGPSGPITQAVLTIGTGPLTIQQGADASTALVSGTILAVGGPPVTINGQVLSAVPSGVVVLSEVQTTAPPTIGQPSTLAFGITTNLAGSVVTQAVITAANGQPVTVSEGVNPNTIVVNGVTLSVGGPPATINGQVVSAVPHGFAIRAVKAQATFVGSDGQTHTVDQPLNGTTAVLEGTTLSVGGPPVTVDGQTLYLSPTGLVIEDRNGVESTASFDVVPEVTTSAAPASTASNPVAASATSGGNTGIADAIIGRCPRLAGLIYTSSNNGIEWLVSCGVIYDGDVIGTLLRRRKLFRRASSDDCENQCASMSNCAGFTYTDSQCTFYSSVNGSHPSVDPAYSAERLNNGTNGSSISGPGGSSTSIPLSSESATNSEVGPSSITLPSGSTSNQATSSQGDLESNPTSNPASSTAASPSQLYPSSSETGFASPPISFQLNSEFNSEPASGTSLEPSFSLSSFSSPSEQSPSSSLPNGLTSGLQSSFLSESTSSPAPEGSSSLQISASSSESSLVSVSAPTPSPESTETLQSTFPQPSFSSLSIIVSSFSISISTTSVVQGSISQSSTEISSSQQVSTPIGSSGTLSESSSTGFSSISVPSQSGSLSSSTNGPNAASSSSLSQTTLGSSGIPLSDFGGLSTTMAGTASSSLGSSFSSAPSNPGAVSSSPVSGPSGTLTSSFSSSGSFLLSSSNLAGLFSSTTSGLLSSTSGISTSFSSPYVLTTTTRPSSGSNSLTAASSSAPPCPSDASTLCGSGSNTNSETCTSGSGSQYNTTCGTAYTGDVINTDNVVGPGQRRVREMIGLTELLRKRAIEYSLADCQTLCDRYPTCIALNYIGTNCTLLSRVTGTYLIQGAVAAEVAPGTTPVKISTIPPQSQSTPFLTSSGGSPSSLPQSLSSNKISQDVSSLLIISSFSGLSSLPSSFASDISPTTSLSHFSHSTYSSHATRSATTISSPYSTNGANTESLKSIISSSVAMDTSNSVVNSVGPSTGSASTTDILTSASLLMTPPFSASGFSTSTSGSQSQPATSQTLGSGTSATPAGINGSDQPTTTGISNPMATGTLSGINQSTSAIKPTSTAAPGPTQSVLTSGGAFSSPVQSPVGSNTLPYAVSSSSIPLSSTISQSQTAVSDTAGTNTISQQTSILGLSSVSPTSQLSSPPSLTLSQSSSLQSPPESSSGTSRSRSTSRLSRSTEASSQISLSQSAAASSPSSSLFTVSQSQPTAISSAVSSLDQQSTTQAVSSPSIGSSSSGPLSLLSTQQSSTVQDLSGFPTSINSSTSRSRTSRSSRTTDSITQTFDSQTQSSQTIVSAAESLPSDQTISSSNLQSQTSSVTGVSSTAVSSTPSEVVVQSQSSSNTGISSNQISSSEASTSPTTSYVYSTRSSHRSTISGYTVSNLSPSATDTSNSVTLQSSVVPSSAGTSNMLTSTTSSGAGTISQSIATGTSNSALFSSSSGLGSSTVLSTSTQTQIAISAIPPCPSDAATLCSSSDNTTSTTCYSSSGTQYNSTCGTAYNGTVIDTSDVVGLPSQKHKRGELEFAFDTVRERGIAYTLMDCQRQCDRHPLCIALNYIGAECTLLSHVTGTTKMRGAVAFHPVHLERKRDVPPIPGTIPEYATPLGI